METQYNPNLCTYIDGHDCKEGCYPNKEDVKCSSGKQKRKRKLLLLKVIECVLLTICVVATISAIFTFNASLAAGAVSFAFVLCLVNLSFLIALMMLLHNSTKYVVEMHDLVVTLQLLVTVFISAAICAASAVTNIGLAITSFFAFVLVIVLIVDLVKQIKHWPVTVTRLDSW